MANAPEEGLRVNCECGARLKVPAKAAGRKVKCPKCGAILSISPPPPPPEEPVGLPGESDTGAFIDQLAAEARSAPAVSAGSPPVGTPTQCPGCGVELSPGAMLCVSCGYSLATGQTMKPAKAGPAPSGRGRAASAGGRQLLGCGLSAAGALIGAAVWFVIAAITQYELGLVAWGVGLLAGLGMLLGTGSPSSRGGVIAAGIAVLGILAAKIMIFAFVIYILVTGNTNDIDLQREYVIAAMTDEVLDEREVWSDDERESQWDDALAEAEGRVSKMSDDQVRAHWKRFREEAGAFEFDEAQLKQARLASHQATLRAQVQGLSYVDEAREAIYEEERSRAESLSEDELDQRLAELDAWEAGGKWSDPQYVRAYLIYEHIDRALEAAPERNEDDEDEWFTPEEWQRYYRAAEAQVDALPPEQQLAQAREIDAEYERELEEAAGEWAGYGDEGGDGLGDLVGVFFVGMFGVFDVLWIALAIGSAYKLAAKGIAGGD